MSRDICEVEEVIFFYFYLSEWDGDPNLAEVQFFFLGGGG